MRGAVDLVAQSDLRRNPLEPTTFVGGNDDAFGGQPHIVANQGSSRNERRQQWHDVVPAPSSRSVALEDVEKHISVLALRP